MVELGLISPFARKGGPSMSATATRCQNITGHRGGSETFAAPARHGAWTEGLCVVVAGEGVVHRGNSGLT